MKSLELKMAKWPGFVALLALQVVSLRAQVPAVPAVQEVEIKTLPKRFVGDELELWASPFRRAIYTCKRTAKPLPVQDRRAVQRAGVSSST
jgi:hypothetical protein